MLRIIYLTLLTFFAAVNLQAQCTNELDITVVSTFCVPNEDTNETEYYVYFIVEQSLNTTSFYRYFIGSPAIIGEHPYGMLHVVGPLATEDFPLLVVDGQNADCTESVFVRAEEFCAPLACSEPDLVLEIVQETICPGESINYVGADPNLFSLGGFRVTEQLATEPFTENSQFSSTVGGRANPSVYAQPNTWYYVRLVYTLVTQQGPQWDFNCTVYSNVDSFYVAGTDLSHLQPVYDLNCIEAVLSLTAAVEGPIPPVIVWSRNGTPISTQNTVTITQIGQYTLTVTDEAGCTAIRDFEVVDEGFTNFPTAFELQGCPEELVYCLFPFEDGWSFTWPEGVTAEGNCAYNLTPGASYDVTITNESGCAVTFAYVTPFSAPDFLWGEAVENGECEADALVLNIQLNSGFSTGLEVVIVQLGGDFVLTQTYFESGQYLVENLGPGTYRIDGFSFNGCFAEGDQVTIGGGGPVIASAAVEGVDCNGAASGSIDLTAEGGQGELSYNWSDLSGSEQPANRTDLVPGTYSVTVNDQNGCSAEGVYIIEEQLPLLIELVNLENAECGNNNGLIEINVSGGQPGPNNFYQTFWSNGWDTEENFNLAPGEYTVTVTDWNGCEAIATYEVLQDELNVIIDSGLPFLGCGNEAVELFGNPAEPENSFLWIGPAGFTSTDEVIAISVPGEYTLTVTTIEGCSGTSTITIGDETQAPALNVVATPLTCDVPGAIAINLGDFDAEQSVGLYLVSSDGNSRQLIEFIDIAFEQEYTFGNLAVGTYEVIVTNEYGCTTTQTVEVGNETFIELLSVTIEDIFCDGQTGSIDVTFANPANFTYFWSYENRTTEDLTGIEEPGLITLSVMDGNECAAVFSFLVNQTSSLPEVQVVEVAPACNGGLGSLCVEGAEELELLTYAWNTGATTVCLEGVEPGNYTVTITDANGCIAVLNGTLLDRAPDVSLDFTHPGCSLDGTIEVIGAPGNPFLTYAWSNGAISPFIDNLPAGDYFVTVTSSIGCSTVLNVQLIDETGFTVSLAIENPEECTEFVVLRPTYAPNFPENLLGHQWTTPDGETFEFPIGGLAVTEPGLYTYTTTVLATGCVASATIFVPEIGDGCHNLSGRLFADEGNCVYDGTEIIVPNWRVEIESTTSSFATTAFTDAAGNWEAEVPLGTFTVRALPYVEPLYTECVPLQTVTVTNGASATVDVLMPYTDECASMYANVTIPFLRRCFENEFYVFYCNDGPVVAENAELIVEMDPFLDFIEASFPPSSLDARTVTFELGDLPPFFCGFISITALVSCDAVLGQTHCVEVTATPNDPCPDPDNWNGANLTLEADCDGEEVLFSIRNNGSAAMSVPLQYIVIEDGIMLMEGPQPGPVLEAGEVFEFTFPADGSTYYVQANQEPGNPAFSMPTLVVEGCGTNAQGSFTTGLVNNLPLGDNDVMWYDISCRQNAGAYDPNAKEGFPLGFGDRNYIAEGTKLTYDIYFQNTGTDTAFTVVIRDTLAVELDPRSLRMGAASHAYVADLDSNNVLTITFDNILLPDSTTDLAGSQGVVQFTIDHTVGLPLETQIRNDAAIYFDFNEPIITNNTLHTLGDDFLPTEVREIVIVSGGIDVYPNPAKHNVNFTLDLPGAGPFKLRLFDAFGRELRSQTQLERTGNFDLSDLPRGWYLLRGENEAGGARAAARILLQ